MLLTLPSLAQYNTTTIAKNSLYIHKSRPFSGTVPGLKILSKNEQHHTQTPQHRYSLCTLLPIGKRLNL